MRDWLDEARHSLRQLAARPGFTAVAVAVLALGIGANTAVFSLVNALLLRPAVAADPHRLVHVQRPWPGWKRGPSRRWLWRATGRPGPPSARW